jgi:Putative MetA-pathway of phenol degradation
MARELTIMMARPAGLAIAFALAGLVSADSGVAFSPARPGGTATMRDAAYARIAANVEQVTAELSAAQARAGTARPLDMTTVEPDRTPHIPKPKPHDRDPGTEPVALPSQRIPQLKPHDRDRSDAVMALLAQANATTSDVARNLTADAAQAAAPIRAQEAVAPQEADDRPSASGGRASAAEPDPAVEALRRELETRDAVIANLLQRVEQLERRIVLTDAQLDQMVAGAAPPRPGEGFASGVPAAAAPEPAPEPEAPRPAQVAAADQEADQTAAPPPAAPGQFEVDEDAIDRALERTLVQEGVLLLPLGQAEIEPSFTYTRREFNVPTFVIQNGDTFVGEQKLRRNEFATNATLRVGLPWDSQIEVGVPYNYVDQDVTTTVGGAPQSSNNESGHGFGDVSVGLAKTLLQEGAGWWPDVIGRVTWDADTGKTSDNGVFLGGGFNTVGGSLSAVKRQDPLAFVGSVSYAKTFEDDDIEPGDEVGFSLGTVLAASPETSLSFFFNQTFADDTKIDGDTINGSDQVIGTFSIGAATILGRNVLLSITGEIGLTDDAPDYAIGASLPIRFDLPTF